MFDIPLGIKYQILEWLGYSPDSPYPTLISFRTQADLDNFLSRASGLIDRLATCQQQIDDALPDSLAVKLDTLEVSYTNQLALLNQHGRRMTNQLSLLANLPVRSTYFTGSQSSRFVG